MFFKKNNVKKGARKMDKLITGLIVGSAVAGMIGLSRTNKGKKVTGGIKKGIDTGFSKSKSIFGVALVKVINFFKKK